MRAVVPNNVVDNEYKAFPKGNYDGTITGAAVRMPKNDNSWVVIKLSLSDVTPREGTSDPGRSAFSSDITLVNTDKDGTVVDVRDLTHVNGDLPFSIERAAGLLAGLGLAVGAAERTDEGTIVDLAGVAEQLAGGAFEGQRIGFSVGNYTPKSQPDKTYDQFERIGPSAS